MPLPRLFPQWHEPIAAVRNIIEFDRQSPKTVAAILAMDPDVIGFNEIENDGYGPNSAIAVPGG